MNNCIVHHIEFGVKDGEKTLRQFTGQYEFKLVATRNNRVAKQWVVRSGQATFLLTQPNTEHLSDAITDIPASTIYSCLETDPYIVPWDCGDVNVQPIDVEHKSILNFAEDSVFNVALTVKDIRRSVDRLTKAGAVLVKSVRTVTDADGEVQVAVVKSCIGNVVHTLVQCDRYHGVFLPSFCTVPETVTSSYCSTDQIVEVTHVDHVTFACKCGSSNDVMQWYENCFGMQRFLINRDEDVANGFMIDTEDIGLRLKAFEYWKCAETGLTTDIYDKDSFKFVIAEALAGQGPNQVDTFLEDHGGPGIQHVGLHIPDIVTSVSLLMQRGVQFVEPPFTYYTEVGKLEEIQAIGQDVILLKKNGILVDAEADPWSDLESTSEHISSKCRYLMQKFTKPLFDRNTFFLEVIQRVGARGFGSGNITALWRSVQAYQNSQAENKSS